ncbi:MAG TPA: DEAD/DEAH box helicase [Flavitalea sp.]|nr:DEAD/DEAH box helicase [Flavitalea sp.]
MSFESLKLIEPICKALATKGYENPTPIQTKAIPVILEGRDLLGCAQTGTGKTAAFALPIIQLLANNPVQDAGRKPIRSLILTPTRELAIQIGENFESFSSHTGIRHAVVFGGVPQRAQVETIRRGVDVLIATPGRLLDLISQRIFTLRDLEIFVLDEADRMLDLGFVNDVKKVIRMIPEQRQTLFFSATMPPTIQQLANSILNQPVKVQVTPVSSTAELVEQSVFFVEKQDKQNLLVHVLTNHTIDSALVFTKTKHTADRVAKNLNKAGIRAEAIHGDKSQGQRQRALDNFKQRNTRVLVATDIAARGIDIENLSHVINYELPNIPETYVHRIGRTGRAGAEGIAFSFCDREEKMYLRDIHRLISREIVEDKNHPFPVSFEPVRAAVSSSGSTMRARNPFRSGKKSWSQA